MKFKYTALGASNQKLEGVLDAESLDAARGQLHKMGLSVVAISEVSKQEAAKAEGQKVTKEKEEGITTFYFVAQDPAKKEVNGTIDSKDANSAYRRLMTEYGFTVLDLYPQGASDPAAASLKAQFEEWKSEMEAEGIDLSKKATTRGGNEEEEGEKINEEVIAEMDQFIINTKAILKNHSSNYSDAFIKEIQKTLNELERVRSSNNLKHITKICNELYELVSNPDNLNTDAEADNSEYDLTMSKLKGSGFISNRFQFQQLHNLQKKLARFEKIQRFIARVKKIVRRKNADNIDKNLATRIERRRSRWFAKLARGLKHKKGEEHPTLFQAISKFFTFLGAPNTILRRARKQEMLKSFNAWKASRKQRKEKSEEVKKMKKAKMRAGMSETHADMEDEAERDFSTFFMELDSFVGWLLFFYITYFFLVSFSIEKNVGLSKELVLKTLSSPLIINISIFLVIAHLAFALKIRLFRANFLGSLFLFFLCFGLYTILIVNF